jgi:glutamate---cysteine ligase / carboxylate-amine ligase
VTELPRKRLGLFEAFGVELEYMLVADGTLDVLPVCDRLLEAECGAIQSEVECGDIAWSNELVLHVVELKTAVPAPSVLGLADLFQQQVRRINQRLQVLRGRLMPSAMHPWMDPDREMQLWPHDYGDVYDAFHRIFDCRGHGWANLQSVHLNLPFANDSEFARLHAAIRLVLPLLPALAAASPLMDGRETGRMDNRLHVYRSNSRRIPEVAGRVIPERAYSEADYHRLILDPLFAAIAPHDPDEVLRDEFLNARGAIARFGRGSIEIRVLDIQECPAADLAVLQAVIAVLSAMTQERWATAAAQQAVDIEPLHQLLLSAIDSGEEAVIRDPQLLRLYGWTSGSSCSMQQLWRHLVADTQPATDPRTAPALEVILRDGPLARRMTRYLQADNSRASQHRLAAELCNCLENGRLFRTD